MFIKYANEQDIIMEMDDIHIEYILKINVEMINLIMKYENKKINY